MRHYILLTFLLIAFLFSITGCKLAQSGFARIAGNAGGEFAAATNTLNYVHQGKLTPLYAASSFAGYQSQLSGFDHQLSSQQGVPDKHTLHNLLSLYTSAMHVVNAPCLSNSCDWHSQVRVLQQASQAFLKAAGQ